MKLGLDIHGILDTHTDKFVELAKCKIWEEVHIITGVTITEELVTGLKNYNKGKKFWTHLVSVQDSLMEELDPLGYDEHNRPYWDDMTWNKFKGEYCNTNKIDLHFDDTSEYEIHFKRYNGSFAHGPKFILYK